MNKSKYRRPPDHGRTLVVWRAISGTDVWWWRCRHAAHIRPVHNGYAERTRDAALAVALRHHADWHENR